MQGTAKAQQILAILLKGQYLYFIPMLDFLFCNDTDWEMSGLCLQRLSRYFTLYFER